MFSDFTSQIEIFFLSAIMEAVKASAMKGSPPFTPYIDPAGCSLELYDLCMRCYSLDPAKRPSMADLRKTLKEQGKLMYERKLAPAWLW